MKIERHSTNGAYNFYGHLSNKIRYEESKIIAFGGPLREDIVGRIDIKNNGGIIVFSTDVNAIKQDENKVIDWIKKKAKTFRNRIAYKNIVNRIAQKHDEVYAWTIGRFLKGRYKTDNGNIFDENSISIELLGVPNDKIIEFAEELCADFDQETVLVKLYDPSEILFVNSNHSKGINENYRSGDSVEYKGWEIEYFPYDIQYKDEESHVNAWIIRSPYYLTNHKEERFYLPLFCEDEYGRDIDFETLEQAKEYIDEYIVPQKGEIIIKHRDECHYVIKEEAWEKKKVNEGGLSRIWQHTKDDDTFAIIGSQDKDTKEDRRDELIDMVSRLSHKRDSKIGYKPLFGRYEYEDGTVVEELSLIIFNINKDDSLRIAQKLNQESIIWKDADFFGFLTANGEEDGEFSYTQNNMNFSDDDIKLYGSRLARHKNKNQQKWFKFVMECYETNGSRNAVRNMGTKPMRKREELFHIYSDDINEGVYKKKKTKHGYITYGTCANPDFECKMFNTLTGADRFSSNGEFTSNGGDVSSSGGVSEAYNDEVVQIAYEMLGGNKVYGYAKKSDLRDIIDGEKKRLWVYDNIEDVGNKYGNGTIRRENILRAFGDSEEAKMINYYVRKMTPQKERIMKEDIYRDSPYEVIDSKMVMDSDGFYTDYTWYRDKENGTSFFMFGDKDIYAPDPDYADYVCDSDEEAEEWFSDYIGFEDDDDDFDYYS